MAGEVNGVNGTGKVEDTKPKGEQRVVEQKAEEMFDYGSENDIGDGLKLVATGANVGEAIIDGVKNPNGLTLLTTGFGANIGKAIVDMGKTVPEKIHSAAEQSRNFRKEHPILGKFMGLGAYAVEWLDKAVNGGK